MAWETAGQMLAMMAMLKTAPRDAMPPSLLIVEAAIEGCIQNLLRARPPTTH